jgi:transmembrane sensor
MNATAAGPSLQIKAQAAAWLAALRGPNRTPELEGRFKRWLDEDVRHRAVWERMSDGWELAGALQVDMRRVAVAADRGAQWTQALAAAVLVAVLAGGAVAYFGYSAWRDGAVSTAVGEQRAMTLQDGTRVVLNTDTHVRIRYGEAERRVVLERGEALFEVAQEAAWPFVVVAGDEQIRALGTAFLVRRDELGLAVTLMEGKVAVSSSFPFSPVAGGEDQGEGVLELAPGERVRIAPRQAPKLDRPELKRITAWRRGEVAFDETPLPEAIAEMNRYSTLRIRLEAPGEGRRVSGLFRAGDSLDFARGVAATFGLELVERDDRLVLSAAE